MKQDMTVQKKTSIGGQALIEGIMMRGPETTSMVVRHVSGELVLEKWPTKGKNRPRFCKLPLIRGVVNMVDSLVFGYRCLMRSAELSGLDEETSPPKTAPAVAAGETNDGSAAEAEAPAQKSVSATKQESSSVGMTLLMILSVILGFGLALVLFMYLPSLVTGWLTGLVPALATSIWRAVLEGVLKISIFLVYIVLVSQMKDIRRVFMYHGAEHKTIFCYEKGLPLTVENVRIQSRFHPRCGTSFLILMLLVGIVIAMFITASQPIVRVGIKLLTIPLMVGIGYELIKWAGRSDNLAVRIISAPGLWVQRITTKEPTDDMIEVAIRALEEVIPDDPQADVL